MKKLTLITLWLLMTSFVAVHADDLSDLDALLNDPTLTDTWTTTTGDTATTTWDETTDDEETVSKIDLQLTGEVTTGSVTLTFQKVGDYTNYKIYYAPIGDNNLKEDDVKATGDNVVVTVKGLDSGVEYQFIAKAFDDEGNPIEATTSDPVTATTATEQHAAPSDNVLYNPVVKVENNNIVITWKAGADVDKVQISMSEDGKTFKPVATVNGSQNTYTIKAETTGKKYIKLVPIAKDGTLGVCKTAIANVQPKKEAQKKMGHPKTGPETYLILLLALIAASAYVFRKRQA